jgi:glycolate oxidase FAD binding subunit
MTLAADVANRLGKAIGAHRLICAEEELAGYAIDGLMPRAIVSPASPEEAAEVVRFAISEKLAVLPAGSKSKWDLGMAPERYDIAIDTTSWRGVAHFDPGDLTLSVDAGMPLRELEQFLKEKGQFLPLAVPCFESATIGGTVASGIDSALRLQYGSARDFLIGAEFIDGTGQLCRSGGRVVKNVTGYDLHKLLIGSLGTLGVITRVNFRTFPLPATCGGHLAEFDNSRAALRFTQAVDKTGLSLANLEILSPEVSDLIRVILQKSADPAPPELQTRGWRVYSSFEGNEEVVQRTGRDLQKIARDIGALRSRVLEKAEDESIGGMLRECFEWLRWASPATVICRLALPVVRLETLAAVAQLAESAKLRWALLVRAAGVVYFAVFSESEDDLELEPLKKIVNGVRSIAQAENGCCTLLHAPAKIKSKPTASNLIGDALLHQRVKRAFDPSGVFAPGRIVGGI